jgi:hypothetical protein
MFGKKSCLTLEVLHRKGFGENQNCCIFIESPTIQMLNTC